MLQKGVLKRPFGETNAAVLMIKCEERFALKASREDTRFLVLLIPKGLGQRPARRAWDN